MPASSGSFKKGQSGNPGGRPKETKDVRDLARQYTEQAVLKLVYWMNQGANPRASVAACTALLDRAWGKPAQELELSAKDGASLPIQVIVNCKPIEQS